MVFNLEYFQLTIAFVGCNRIVNQERSIYYRNHYPGKPSFDREKNYVQSCKDAAKMYSLMAPAEKDKS